MAVVVVAGGYSSGRCSGRYNSGSVGSCNRGSVGGGSNGGCLTIVSVLAVVGVLVFESVVEVLLCWRKWQGKRYWQEAVLDVMANYPV